MNKKPKTEAVKIRVADEFMGEFVSGRFFSSPRYVVCKNPLPKKYKLFKFAIERNKYVRNSVEVVGVYITDKYMDEGRTLNDLEEWVLEYEDLEKK